MESLLLFLILVLLFVGFSSVEKRMNRVRDDLKKELAEIKAALTPTEWKS